MPLKLYAVPLSQPARAVMWALEAGGTPYELVQTMPGKDTRKKEYAAAGAIQTVPRIDDDGFILNESHAIMSYLGAKHGWELYPTDLKTKAKVDQYFNWHHRNTRELTLAMFAPAMRPDVKIPEAQRVAGRALTKGMLRTLERWLTEADYIAGAKPTLADIAAYCEVGQCKENQYDLIDLSPYPKVQAWLDRCEKIPGHKKSHTPVYKLSARLKPQLHKANGGARAKL